MQPHSSELGQKMTSEGAGDDKPEVRGDGLSTHNRITIHKTEVSMMRYGRKQSCDGNSSQRHPAPRALLGRFIWGDVGHRAAHRASLLSWQSSGTTAPLHLLLPIWRH